MYGVQALSAVILATAAFSMDLYRQKISNIWICLGWIWGFCIQIQCNGGGGIIRFFMGAGTPILWLFVLFHFRMLGPGDIKLLSVLGGLLGYHAAVRLTVMSFIFGGILAFGLLITSGALVFRFWYFTDYFKMYFKDWKHRPYYKTGERVENFHFTLPILLGVFLYVGGIC